MSSKQTSGPTVKAGMIVAGGVILSLSSAVIFSIGWEQSGTFRGLIAAFGLLCLGASLFAFAEGWDCYKATKNSASVSGTVKWPAHPPRLRRDARVELTSQAGEIAASSGVGQNGAFEIRHVPDGVWSLTIDGPWIRPISKELRLQRRERLDLGQLQARFEGSQVYQTEALPLVNQLQSYVEDTIGTEWAVGFLTKNKVHNSRIVLAKEKGKRWTERIIPCLSKAERAEFIKILRAGEIVIGSLDAGACYSNDSGLTWNKMDVPTEVNSISSIYQLPDHSLLASAWKFRGGNSPAGFVLRYPSIDSVPSLVWELEAHRVNSFYLTTSGRALLATGGSEARIYFSEDHGDSWQASSLSGEPFGYGRFGSFTELDGVLHALFRPVSGDGLYLRSTTDGVSWEILPPPAPTPFVCGLVGTNGGILAVGSTSMMKPPLLIYSADNGQAWEPLFELEGAPHPHGHIGRFEKVGGKFVYTCLNSITKIVSDCKPEKFA